MNDSQQHSTHPAPATAACFVTCTLLFVGCYDVLVGLYMLVSDTPWLAHGPGTLWVEAAGGTGAATESLYRRVGAFSLHAGILTIALAWYARHRTGLRTLVVSVYLLTGAGFAWTDTTWFSGTAYWWLKQAIGLLFAAAAVTQLIIFFRERRARAGPV